MAAGDSCFQIRVDIDGRLEPLDRQEQANGGFWRFRMAGHGLY